MRYIPLIVVAPANIIAYLKTFLSGNMDLDLAVPCQYPFVLHALRVHTYYIHVCAQEWTRNLYNLSTWSLEMHNSHIQV
jgi:hypothetical protein